jgi:outer membrane protein assembly factor BamD
MNRRLLLLVWLLGLATTFCAGRGEKSTMYPEDRLALADRLRSEGKCSKAVIEYEQLLSEFPSQQLAEQAEYNLATCRMELEEYDFAIQGFEDFIDSYSRSELVDNALYMIALSYMKQSPRPERDQSKTSKALGELYLLLREYPDTDVRDDAEKLVVKCRSKLAEKEYLNAYLYFKLGHNESARIYFDSLLEDYGDTRWAAPALLGKGLALARENRVEEARQAFEQVLRDYPESGYSEEAAQKLKELEGATELRTQVSPQE